MQKLPTYYQGSSIALIIRTRGKEGETPVALSDYDIDAVLYTRLVGEKIRLSSRDTSQIAIHIIDGSTLAANIPSEATEAFPPGECTLQLTFTNKETGTRHIASRKILLLEYAVKD